MNLRELTEDLIQVKMNDEMSDVILAEMQECIGTSDGMLASIMFSDSEAWDSEKESRLAMVRSYLIAEIGEMIEDVKNEKML